VDLRPIDVRDAGEIERAVTAFAESPNGGLVVFGSPGAGSLFGPKVSLYLALRSVFGPTVRERPSFSSKLYVLPPSQATNILGLVFWHPLMQSLEIAPLVKRSQIGCSLRSRPPRPERTNSPERGSKPG
jgi:hypothetical protein